MADVIISLLILQVIIYAAVAYKVDKLEEKILETLERLISLIEDKTGKEK